MRGKCKGARAEIDIRLLEVATVSVEVRAFRKVADIRVATTNALVTWEADIDMLRKPREMFEAAEQVLVHAMTARGRNIEEADEQSSVNSPSEANPDG